MKTAIVVSLAMATPAAAGTDCAAGYKHKKDLTNLFCNDAATKEGGCNGNCCEDDKTTCGGLYNAESTARCGFGSYSDDDDAWKRTKTTAYDKKSKVTDVAQFGKDCCKPVATCANTLYTCAGGTKGKSGVAAIHCPAGPASCATSTACCDVDETTCGGYFEKNKGTWPTFKCDANSYPLDKAKDAILKDPTWKAIKNTAAGNFDAAKFKAQCCIPQANCASPGYQCPAGSVKDKSKLPPNAVPVCGPKTISGSTDQEYAAANCAVGKTCCKADPTTCGAAAVTCAASMYKPTTDNWKGKKFQTGKANLGCCTEKATCATAQCGAGNKKKVNVDSLACPSNEASCADTPAGRCCEVDKATCGGLRSSIQCPYGYFNEATTWTAKTTQATKDAWKNRKTTAATKNTDCCTEKAQCLNGITTTPAATITPAPVTVAPPAVAARLYSAHKTAAQQVTEAASNGMWVGAGAIMGMAVLMAMQRFRSTRVESAMAARDLAAIE